MDQRVRGAGATGHLWRTCNNWIKASQSTVTDSHLGYANFRVALSILLVVIHVPYTWGCTLRCWSTQFQFLLPAQLVGHSALPMRSADPPEEAQVGGLCQRDVRAHLPLQHLTLAAQQLARQLEQVAVRRGKLQFNGDVYLYAGGTGRKAGESTWCR